MSATSYLGHGPLADRPTFLTIPPDAIGLYWADDVNQLSLWAEGNTWSENILIAGVLGAEWGLVTGTLADQTDLQAALDQLEAGIIAAGGTQQIYGLVSGGQVAWESGLTFRVSSAQYFINGVLYSSAEQTVTLDAAHATLNRIDVIALNTAGTLVKITGDPNATPSEPDVDPSTQLKLTFVVVDATVTAPAGVVVEDVYLENTEWTSSTSGSGFNANSSNNPYAGTKDIEFTAAANGAYVQLQRSSSIDLSSYDLLRLFIRSKASWNSNRILRIQFLLNGVAKGQPVTLASGYWGFDSSITSGYQFAGIPMNQFVIPAGTLVNQIRIIDVGGSIGGYIDNITIQDNGASIGDPNITQAEGDARYLQRANNLSDLTSASTARTNLGLGTAAVLSTSDVDERARDAVGTAIVPGQSLNSTVSDPGDTITLDVVPDVQSVTSSTTVTPTFNDDMVKITAQAAALALANPTGTAVPGKGLVIRIKDNGTARAISYGTQYRAIGVTLPTTTVVNKTLYLGLIYNADDTKWDCVAVKQEA